MKKSTLKVLWMNFLCSSLLFALNVQFRKCICVQFDCAILKFFALFYNSFVCFLEKKDFIIVGEFIGEFELSKIVYSRTTILFIIT
jgi:hypothetical protein